MFDLDAFQPFVIAFFLIAAAGIGMAVATLVSLTQERRATTRRVIPISSAHPAVAAITRRAA